MSDEEIKQENISPQLFNALDEDIRRAMIDTLFAGGVPYIVFEEGRMDIHLVLGMKLSHGKQKPRTAEERESLVKDFVETLDSTQKPFQVLLAVWDGNDRIRVVLFNDKQWHSEKDRESIIGLLRKSLEYSDILLKHQQVISVLKKVLGTAVFIATIILGYAWYVSIYGGG